MMSCGEKATASVLIDNEVFENYEQTKKIFERSDPSCESTKLIVLHSNIPRSSKSSSIDHRCAENASILKGS